MSLSPSSRSAASSAAVSFQRCSSRLTNRCSANRPSAKETSPPTAAPTHTAIVPTTTPHPSPSAELKAAPAPSVKIEPGTKQTAATTYTPASSTAPAAGFSPTQSMNSSKNTEAHALSVRQSSGALSLQLVVAFWLVVSCTTHGFSTWSTMTNTSTPNSKRTIRSLVTRCRWEGGSAAAGSVSVMPSCALPRSLLPVARSCKTETPKRRVTTQEPVALSWDS